jgi:hypothetical protein
MASCFDASEDSDYVYGLLGFFPDRFKHIPNLRADYHKDASQLFKEITQKMILYQKDLEAITFDYWTDPGLKGPSWVPQWNYGIKMIDWGPSFFSASSNVPMEVSFDDTEEGPVMNVSGCKVGKVRDSSIHTRATAKKDKQYWMKLLPWFHSLSDRDRALAAIAMGLVLGHNPSLEKIDPDDAAAALQCWLHKLFKDEMPSDFELPAQFLRSGLDNPEIFEQWMNYSSSEGRFFVTEGHPEYVGIAMTDRDLQTGDVICILFGGQYPFILRSLVTGGSHLEYSLIGFAYIHGMMYGEAIVEVKKMSFKIR